MSIAKDQSTLSTHLDIFRSTSTINGLSTDSTDMTSVSASAELSPVEIDQLMLQLFSTGGFETNTLASLNSSCPNTPTSTAPSHPLDPANDGKEMSIDDLIDVASEGDFDSELSHVSSPVPAKTGVMPDPNLAGDPTMLSIFPTSFASYELFPTITSQDLGNVTRQFQAPVHAPSVPDNLDSIQAWVNHIDWRALNNAPGSGSTINPRALTDSPVSAAVAISPSPVGSPQPAPLKRKASDASEGSEPFTKRPRGRPPKSSSLPKRPYHRKSTLPPSPLSASGSLVPEAPQPSVKPSTARPRSIVPDKYIKDGSAEENLGMSIDLIQSFPSYEELLKAVSPEYMERAIAFGVKLESQRNIAAEAARRTREEKKNKMGVLEEQVEGLQEEVESVKKSLGGLKAYLIECVAKGVVPDLAALASYE